MYLWLITLFVSGCVYYRETSKLHIDDNTGWKTKSWVYGGVQQNWLDNDSVRIMVRPHNYGKYSAITILPVPLIPIPAEDNVKRDIFAISLVFASGINTSQGVPNLFRFDPYQVTLQTVDGKTSWPIGYIRPDYNDHRCYQFDYDRQYLLNSEVQNLPSGWLEFPEEKNGRCFYLIYGMAPPPPIETFSLKINALKLGDKLLNVPKMTFRKGYD